jgi:lipopolysaccharide transport system ATP-binding protein
MSEVAGEGRTVVFVSHNLAIIQALCERGILLERGKAIADAGVGEAIDVYLRTLERSAAEDLVEREDRDGRSWDQTRIKGVLIRSAGSGHPDVVVGGESASIEVKLTEVLPMLECRITIVNSLGQAVATLDSETPSPEDQRDPDIGSTIECELSSLPLLPGRYRLDIVIKGRRQIQDGLKAAAFFDVEPGIVANRPMPTSGLEGDIALEHAWRLPS